MRGRGNSEEGGRKRGRERRKRREERKKWSVGESRRQREKGGRRHVRYSPPNSLRVQCTTDCDHSSPTTDGEHTCRRGGGKE